MVIPGSTLIPSARYRDAHAAIEWLCNVFGFHKQAVYEGPNGTVAHAQLTLGNGMFMLGSQSNESEFHRSSISLAETGGRETLGLYLVVEDCDGVYARAKQARAEIVQELHSPPYGGWSFACRDCEGHIWWIGSYNPWSEEQADTTVTDVASPS